MSLSKLRKKEVYSGFGSQKDRIHNAEESMGLGAGKEITLHPNRGSPTPTLGDGLPAARSYLLRTGKFSSRLTQLIPGSHMLLTILSYKMHLAQLRKSLQCLAVPTLYRSARSLPSLKSISYLSPCKIKTRVTYFEPTMAWNVHQHSKKEEWDRASRDWTKQDPTPVWQTPHHSWLVLRSASVGMPPPALLPQHTVSLGMVPVSVRSSSWLMSHRPGIATSCSPRYNPGFTITASPGSPKYHMDNIDEREQKAGSRLYTIKTHP